MPYKDKNKRIKYQMEYHLKNRDGTRRRVSRHRRKLKSPTSFVVEKESSEKHDVTILSPNTRIEEINCNKPESEPVTIPIVLGKQPVTTPVLTSRGVDKEALLATIRAKTSKILNSEFPRDGEPIVSVKPAEDDQMTVEPFYG